MKYDFEINKYFQLHNIIYFNIIKFYYFTMFFRRVIFKINTLSYVLWNIQDHRFAHLVLLNTCQIFKKVTVMNLVVAQMSFLFVTSLHIYNGFLKESVWIIEALWNDLYILPQYLHIKTGIIGLFIGNYLFIHNGSLKVYCGTVADLDNSVLI